MFWNRNKKNKNADNGAEEQRPLVAARTLIDMGDAAGVWMKTQGDDMSKPAVLVATDKRNALVETATTFMYDLKNSANEGEDVSALAALAFGAAGINALTDAPHIGAQCPLAQGDAGDAAASTEDGGTARWESKTVGCGDGWERELAGALAKK